MDYKRNRRKEKVWCKVTYTVLELWFGVSRYAIQAWIRKGLLDPTDRLDIADKLRHPEKLTRRKQAGFVR